MSRRPVSLIWELEIDGDTIIPLSIAEFSEGAQGMIEVVDGEYGFSIPDGVHKTPPVEVVITITEDKREYNIMQQFANSKQSKNVFVIGRKGHGEVVLQYIFEECLCVIGNKNASDRKSPSEDTKTYSLVPLKVTPIE